jgi:AcrR family transcriptional regulator
MSLQREDILAHACDLYLSDGLEGFSMRKLARAVGVTAPALYRHYESKEHVFVDVVREAYREFSSYLYRALEGRTPEERLRRAGVAYLDFVLEHPRWYRMVFMGPEQMGLETLPPDIETQGCAVHQFWVDRLRECMEAGLLEPDDPIQVGLTLWAHAHGLIRLYQGGHIRMDEEAFRALYMSSGRRMMIGIATGTYREELTRRQRAEAAVELAGS